MLLAEDTSAVQGNVVGGSGEGQTVPDTFAYTDDVMAYVGYDWSDWNARVRMENASMKGNRVFSFPTWGFTHHTARAVSI